MDGDDAVEEGADDAAAAGDVSAKAPRRPVRLRPHMWDEPRGRQRGQGPLCRRWQEERGGGGGGQLDGGGEEAGGRLEEARAEARSRVREATSRVKVRGASQEVFTITITSEASRRNIQSDVNCQVQWELHARDTAIVWPDIRKGWVTKTFKE